MLMANTTTDVLKDSSDEKGIKKTQKPRMKDILRPRTCHIRWATYNSNYHARAGAFRGTRGNQQAETSSSKCLLRISG